MTTFNFEFPHEEAHLIPELFPEAKKWITTLSPEKYTYPGSYVNGGGLAYKQAYDASQFHDAMEDQENTRNEQDRQERLQNDADRRRSSMN